jgi:hypothetical protein
MKRDDDLIRKLMLDLEAASQPITQDHPVAGYGKDQVAYHLALIVRQGFADGPKPLYPNTGEDPTIPRAVIALRLTPAGHDFIASIRDAGIWAKVKERTASVSGGVALDVLKELAVSLTKAHLGIS